LIHHGTIDVPGLAHVEKTNQLEGARILGASSLLSREGLVPVGHSDREPHALKSLEFGPVARTSELLDGVVDDRHGGKVKGGVAACEKNNTAWQGLYRGLLQTVIKALNAKGPKPAHAQSSFLHELLAIGFSVFDLMQASFCDFHDGVFTAPLSEA